MQHDLGGVRLRVVLEALSPVITDTVREDGSGLVEGGGRDAAADLGVALETVLGVLVPEVEGAVGAGRAEGAVNGVERDVIDGIDVGDVIGGRVSVALEGEVGSVCTVLAACRNSFVCSQKSKLT